VNLITRQVTFRLGCRVRRQTLLPGLLAGFELKVVAALVCPQSIEARVNRHPV
jgi:hypothetical protein